MQKIVSKDQWVKARTAFLAKEKEFSKKRDELARLRRELPWVKVDKSYQFDGPSGKVSLADLFAGRSQLIVYHFMFAPDWEEGCKSCSLIADHFAGSLPHLAARDVTLVAVARAPLAKLDAFKKRLGWTFDLLSSNGSDFNYDFGVAFKPEDIENGTSVYNYGKNQFDMTEGPGVSCFIKDENGDIYHTYSSYARGLDILIGAYNYLDLAPKGRDEESLAYGMEWVRHRDKY